MLTRVHAIITGEVQGIGYRWFVEKTGSSAGLSGWVRNLPDGSVEVEAEGDKTILDNFLETLKTGHAWARVDGIETNWAPVKSVKAGGFSIKF
jgi:acylphosphatase